MLARGSDDPAIEVSFTQVSFDRPDAAQFTFNPPPGATVIEETPDAEGHGPNKPEAVKPDSKPGRQPNEAAPGAGQPKMAVIGTGWTSVLVARLPEQSSDNPDQDAPDSLARNSRRAAEGER